MNHKRGRASNSSDGVDVMETTSHLRERNAGRKRVRLTPVANGDGANERNTLSDSDEDRDRRGDSDEEDDELSDSEVLEWHAQRQSESLRKNHAADNGIIEEVTCTNFMCHSNLTMKLGPLINFVIGHNGSGKSAVLTALQLCLGGKATSTNRGQNLKAFIKAGSEQCTLRVKIKNQGDNAYQPEKYQETIIVERTFSRTGTSGFKLKDAQGRLISSKKSDLEDILDALALQMDNPMNVLTQDMARQFLNSSNASEKYTFFYKGTHLEQLDADYRILQESLDQNQTNAYSLKQSLDYSKELYDKAKRKSDQARQTTSLRDQAQIYARQMAWVQVQEQEQELANIEEAIRGQERLIAERRAAAERLDAVLDEIDLQRDSAAKRKETMDEERLPRAEHQAQIKEAFQAVKAQLLESKSQQRDVKGLIDAAKREVRAYREKIQTEKDKIASANNGRHAEQLDEISAAKSRLEELRTELHQQASQSGSLDRAAGKADEEFDNARKALDLHKDSVRDAERRLQKLQNSSGDWMAQYPGTLRQLLRAISDEPRFREAPVGPLGHHISLSQPQWADILEKQSGNALDSFAVTSKADQSILSEIMRRVKYDAQVYVLSARPIDTTQHEPPSQYDTWLRVLRFDQEIVRNCLIINHSADKTILDADSDRASKLIEGNISNVARVFSMNPVPEKGRKWGYVFSKTSTGGPKQDPIHPWNGGRRMQADNQMQISEAKENVAQLSSMHGALQDALQSAQQSQKLAHQAITRHKRHLKDLQHQIDRQETAISDMQANLEEAAPQTGLVETLEEQLKEALETEEMNMNQYQDIVAEIDKLAEDNRANLRALQEADESIAEVDSRIRTLEAQIDRLEASRSREVLKANESHMQLKDAEDHKLELDEQRNGQQTSLEDFTRQATEVSPRIPVDAGETADSLDAKLVKVNRQIAVQEANLGGDAHTLRLKELEAKRDFEARNKAYENNEHTLNTLKQALANRLERWRIFRDKIVARAAQAFNYYLSNRQFDGKLEIDHLEKTLDISVQPDPSKKGKRGRQTKTLSGGEKSFSTICLLLALWEAMGSPIRCLDEFDVFMDQVNRDVSMRMMIEAARSAVSRQFILITPQSMNNIRLAEDVKIHKMTDPERGRERGQVGLTQYIAA